MPTYVFTLVWDDGVDQNDECVVATSDHEHYDNVKDRLLAYLKTLNDSNYSIHVAKTYLNSLSGLAPFNRAAWKLEEAES